jgi:hypothetical protein
MEILGKLISSSLNQGIIINSGLLQRQHELIHLNSTVHYVPYSELSIIICLNNKIGNFAHLGEHCCRRFS